MRSIFNLTSLFTKFPTAIADKLRSNAVRKSELSMKLAGASGTHIRLTAWKPVDSEKIRLNDVLRYSQYKLPRLQVISQQHAEPSANHKIIITVMNERMI